MLKEKEYHTPKWRTRRTKANVYYANSFKCAAPGFSDDERKTFAELAQSEMNAAMDASSGK